jgi:hypothetical protein
VAEKSPKTSQTEGRRAEERQTHAGERVPKGVSVVKDEGGLEESLCDHTPHPGETARVKMKAGLKVNVKVSMRVRERWD